MSDGRTTAVILIGPLDFGRCPLATSLHRSLWPVFDRPMLECQLELLARQGVDAAVVSASEIGAVEEQAGGRAYGVMRVSFAQDRMPRGPAGSLRDAVDGTDAGRCIVVEGAAWVADARALVEAHTSTGAALTVFVPGEAGRVRPDVQPSGIYVCQARAIDLIAAGGYQDIKEQWIPALLREGLDVRAAALPWRATRTRGIDGYLSIVERALQVPGEFGIDETRFQRQGQGVLVAPGAKVSPSARIIGPVAVLDGASVADGAVVAGPAVIGKGARLEERAVVDSSVLWERAVVARGAVVSASVVGQRARIRPGALVERVAVASGGTVRAGTAMTKTTDAARTQLLGWSGRAEMAEVSGAPLAAAGAALLAVFVWSYWSVFGDLWRVWRDNDNYSSGILVPFIAAYVAYARRKDLAAVERRPWLWGLAIILAGFTMRFAGSILLFASAERLSVVVVVAGLVVTVFGLGVARRAAGVLAFLFLMLPWPNRLYNPASMWLQDWAVGSSVFLLETFGCIVSREGNSVLHVGGATVRIAEACNGLRMLTAFMVVSGFMAFVSGRGFFEKAVIFVSSIPIAVACNTLRLTATAIAFSAGYGERVNRFFHDFGGIAMMPLALAIMAGEVWLVRRLFITDESPNASPQAVSQERAGRARP